MIEGELGAFLRSRREATSPEDVGLPAGGRRRTPGLRRSELATLAGISVDYLIRLEQGRDRHPSIQVLTAIADALGLSAADRAHLNQLAVVGQGVGLCPSGRPQLATTVRSATAAVLDALDPAPAYVVNHRSDLLAWNDGFERLARPLGLLDGSPPNLARYVVTDPRARSAFLDWADVADEQVALLHARRRGDCGTAQLVDQLAESAGDEFTRRWERRPVPDIHPRTIGVTHPQVGVLRLTPEPLTVAGPDAQWLTVLVAADEVSAEGLVRLGAGGGEPVLRSLG
ncbi:Helix-turn-helix domain-containing protein [Pseudonocardia thermophila]|uniref:Helix-turn-helix domain-containing protein n=1 Tax=Pseudonocardia thermophila TaxID=1848 RepID=A0A1M6N9S0_PSETH|nr:helix-turn-helix transcriptional regulator [Pseudonocardia thermophila]SHJ92468.1 Helix-turn-helix domain-containing protein [Pseudonocardia thermophila]